MEHFLFLRLDRCVNNNNTNTFGRTGCLHFYLGAALWSPAPKTIMMTELSSWLSRLTNLDCSRVTQNARFRFPMHFEFSDIKYHTDITLLYGGRAISTRRFTWSVFQDADLNTRRCNYVCLITLLSFKSAGKIMLSSLWLFMFQGNERGLCHICN